MLLKLKERIKANNKLEPLVRALLRPFFYISWFYGELVAKLRGWGMLPCSKYKHMKLLRNSHIGERCFIVATGPSLTFDDLDMIKDEYCFGMNSCVLAMDKTKWVPRFFGIQDEYVYKRVEGELLKRANDTLKGSIYVSKHIAGLCPSAKAFKYYPLSFLDHKVHPGRIGKIKFSTNCYAIVYDGLSIIFSLMQIAMYMGFKEIYLLGADSNYNQKKSHFIEHGAFDPNAASLGERLIYVHSLFKEFAEANGVNVYNCTRGGMLEVYTRKRLEDVLNKS